MIVRFKGNNSKGMSSFGWEGVSSYNTSPYDWKEFLKTFVWKENKATVTEVKDEDVGLLKKMLMEKYLDEDVDEQKNKMLISIDEAFGDQSDGVKWESISANEYVLKKALSEERFRLTLVVLKFEMYGDTRDDVWLFVTEEDYLSISDMNGKLIEVINGTEQKKREFNV